MVQLKRHWGRRARTHSTKVQYKNKSNFSSLGALGALDALGALGALGALDALGALGALDAFILERNQCLHIFY